MRPYIARTIPRISVFAAILATAPLALSGCIIGGGSGPLARVGAMQTENLSVPLGKAKEVHAHLEMGAGELNVSGGSSKLMGGTISYNVSEWKPDLSYSENDGSGSLMVMQPESHHSTFGGVKYTWDLHFNSKTPLELAVEMGAGNSNLDLADVALRELNVKVGAGNATIDLTGEWKQDVSVDVQGGVGEVHIKLPRSMSVRVSVQGGLGSVSAPDFKREGSDYVNDAYGSGKPTINVSVSGGIGQVNLELGGGRGIV